MSFEIKYDRDGIPILPKVPPVEVKQQSVQPETKLSLEETLQPLTQQSEIEEPVQEQENLEEIVQEVVQTKQQPPHQEPPQPNESFRELRDKAFKLERERNEYQKRLKEIEEAQTKQYVTHEPQPENDPSLNINADDLVEGKHLSHIDKKIKRLEKELNTYKQQSTLQTTEARLKMQYPDFDKVVSKENVETLRMLHPEIAQTLSTSSDIYSTAVSAYTIIKRMGIHLDEVYEQPKQHAIKNALKPRPTASLSPQQGESPLTKANAFSEGLTDELRAQLLREMNQIRRNS